MGFLHVDDGQVRQQREQPQPVIENHGVSREVQILGEDDATRVWCADGRACRAREISAAVRASRLSVEDASRALSVAWFFVFAQVPTTAADSLAVLADARSIQPGELILLTVTGPESLDTLHVRAFSRDIAGFRVDAGTWRALVGIDLGIAAGTYLVSIDARTGPQQLHATYSLVVRSRRFPARTLNVDPAFVNPPAAMRDRIAREAARLEQLWNQSSPERVWSGGFVVPVPGATASRFGLEAWLRSRRSLTWWPVVATRRRRL